MRRSNQSSQMPTPLRRPRSSAQHMSLAAAIDAFMLHQEATDSQPKTLTWHRHCLGSFRDYCDHHKIMMIEAVTTQDLQHWIIELQKEVTTRGIRSGRTISWYARSTKAFFSVVLSPWLHD